ncbi:zc2hc1a [Symbiodinium sp. CCMP2592]|nr:zc2hc1a [Symbiodinium sp. CCMP2592]
MRSQRPPYQAPPAAAANARDGYAADRTMLPGAAAPSGLHSEDCSCPACETHRTFHALLRGSDPPKHAGPGRPLRRRPAPEWDASEGPPLNDEPKPPLRLMKWQAGRDASEERRPRPGPRARPARAEPKEWNSDVDMPLSRDAPEAVEELDRTAPSRRIAARAASADRPDSNPPSQGFSVEPRARGASAPRRPKAKPAPEPRPPSTNSRPPSGASEGSGCPRCGRALQGRALVMHLKTCGVPSRSRGDPFAKPDPAQSSQSTPTRGYRATGADNGDFMGKAQQQPSPPIPANRRNMPAQERPPSPPLPTHSRRTGPAQERPPSPPLPTHSRRTGPAQERPMSPPLPTASRQNGPVPAARPGSPALPGAGAQAMGSAFGAMQDEAEAPPDERMAPCPHCGRTFRISILDRHMGICQKVFQEKRKVFNAVKQAVPVEAAKAKKAHDKQEKMEKMAQGRKAPQDRPIKPGAQIPTWKKQSEAFRQAVRQARIVDQHVKDGKSLRNLPPPPPTDPSLDDRVPCPHCGRRFGSTQAERHIPFCKTRSAKQRR